MIRAASLVLIPSAATANQPKESLATLERKLHGEWQGGPGEGDWTFAANRIDSIGGIDDGKETNFQQNDENHSEGQIGARSANEHDHDAGGNPPTT